MKLFYSTLVLASFMLASFTYLYPSIKFDKKEHDFGSIPQGDPVKCDFVFTNDGDAPLILTEVKASCGCTTPKWPQEPIMPGQKGTITAEYNAAADGMFNKTISVYTNINSEIITLILRGNVMKRTVELEDEGTELKLGK